MSPAATPFMNHLLGALPVSEYVRLFKDIEQVHLLPGKVLYDSGDDVRYAYFPATCLISLLYVTGCGESAEIAGVGNEGVVGIPLIMGGGGMPHRAVVQSEGYAYRLRATVLQQEFDRHDLLLQLLLRYTQALITQMAQTVVCNRHHSVAQQLCRCLLLCQDRLCSNHLAMTQELIANMLGVRREGVTGAAGNLQRAGLIVYRRGHITVLNREGLEARVCECYQVIRSEIDRLVPIPPDSLN